MLTLLITNALATDTYELDGAPTRWEEHDPRHIEGGDVTDDYPSAAALLIPPAWPARDHGIACTGVLIRPEVVLTAGHCLTGMDVETFGIYFGSDPLGQEGGGGEYVAAERVLPHPEFDPYNTFTTPDLGLIFLAEPALTEPTLEDTQLASNHLLQDVYTVGFGNTGTTGGENMKKVGHGMPRELQMQTIHTDPLDGGGSSGDSGGPVYRIVDGELRVIGIHVSGYGTDGETGTGVSTRLDWFKEWIDEEAGPPPEQAEQPDLEDTAGAGGAVDKDPDQGCACASTTPVRAGWWAAALAPLWLPRRRRA